jgi:hypothetical protein
VDEDIRTANRHIMELQSTVSSLSRQVSNLNTTVLAFKRDFSDALARIRDLEQH